MDSLKRKAKFSELYLESDNFSADDNLSSSPLYAKLKPEAQRYENIKFIAKGGMKEVYKIFDPKVGRWIALASLHKNAPHELYEPFLREAYLTSQLDHPNIITIFDIALDEAGKPYFTMELKTGSSFQEVIENAHKNGFPDTKNLK